MSDRPVPAHPLNRLGIALLIAALACLIGFHALPVFGDTRGWEIWKRIWELLTRSYQPGWKSMIAVSAFLTIAVLVTASPFITFLLRTSKPCRWLAIGASGAGLLGLGGQLLNDPAQGPAFAFLLAAMALNLAGLLCLRSPRFELGSDPS